MEFEKFIQSEKVIQIAKDMILTNHGRVFLWVSDLDGARWQEVQLPDLKGGK